MDVNCCWSLNRQRYMTRCFTRFPQTITASVIMCPKSKTPIIVCVDCVGRVWWRGSNYRWVVRLHGRIAWRQWHLTLSSSFAICYVMCIGQTYCYLSDKYHRESFYNNFSLCTKMVQKLYRNGQPSCTEVVQADSACSSLSQECGCDSASSI